IPLGILAGAGWVGYQKYQQIRSHRKVKTGLVSHMSAGVAEAVLRPTGYLKSRYQAMIGTKVAGRLERMYVEEGMRVKKGDTLAIIEHNDLKAMLASREAQALRTAAELEEAQADLWEKQRENLRASRLLPQRNITPEDAERALAAEKKAAARVSALEAGVKLMQANIKEIQAMIATMFLYAPFDGTVVEKQGEEGEVINPMAMSSSLGRAAAVTIANLDKMDVETDISEGDLHHVSIGQPALVDVKANPSRQYHGRLRKVIPMSERARKTVKVKVEILDPDDKLFPELEATVHFIPAAMGGDPQADRAFLFVPREAVVDENGLKFVWVVRRADLTVHKRLAKVPMTTERYARVDSGLSESEEVVLYPPPNMKDNEAVEITQ
ncbi:MAG TPA: efflux RND transporter periplasmic adaptor subunit, partial [Isosphaeraceae bacterium]|nr:efflux RND transporter periplasmic adaptor subunit [Isosphaeraceae bacterium]